MHRSKIPVKDFGQPSWSKVVFKDLHADGCLMSNHGPRPSYADVVEAMLRPEAYLSEPAVSQSTDRLEKIGHHETHISDVFLAGRLVYKLKKPVKTNFLDYSTLELRKYFCEQEFRLDRRYAQDLYLEVVPITYDGELIRIAGEGETVEYAVKMRRFDSDALLASRVDQGEVTASDIRVIADQIARFHESAERASPERSKRSSRFVLDNIDDVFETLQEASDDRWHQQVQQLKGWSSQFLSRHRQGFIQRGRDGFIRSCHGDLHLENIVYWDGAFRPFDGIEFNEDLRWIDVANDAAFLAMDFAAHDQFAFYRQFLNRYLERTGDYGSLRIMRWFLVYRALVRAMVAAVKAGQHPDDAELQASCLDDTKAHIDLALQFTRPPEPSLTITHGVSGSGKTWSSDRWIEQTDSIRIRSDVERKRNQQSDSANAASSPVPSQLYEESSRDRVYQRLEQLAEEIIRSGYAVIVDATFLQRSHRQAFERLAARLQVPFQILSCHAAPSELERRIEARSQAGDDVSDADLKVLRQQLASQEPLTEEEKTCVIKSDTVAQSEH